MQGSTLAKWLLGLLVLNLAVGETRAALPLFPGKTQFLCRIDCSGFVSAEVVRKDLEPWKTLVGDFRAGLAAIGANPDQVEQVWIGCGEDYPNSLVVVVEGKFDVAKLDQAWQQLVRDRRFNAKMIRDADSVGYSLELPPTALPLPGLPRSIIVAAAGPKAIAIGVVKESIFELTSPATDAARSNIEGQLPKGVALAFVWKLPTTLTATGAILAGATETLGSIAATNELVMEMRIAASSATAGDSLAESIRAGINQMQSVFPPLARQQGSDPRIIRLVAAAVAAARIDGKDKTISVRSVLAGDEIKKLLAKP